MVWSLSIFGHYFTGMGSIHLTDTLSPHPKISPSQPIRELTRYKLIIYLISLPFNGDLLKYLALD